MHTLYMLERLCDYLATYEQKEVSRYATLSHFFILKNLQADWIQMPFWKRLSCKIMYVGMFVVLINTDYYVSSKPKSHGCGD